MRNINMTNKMLLLMTCTLALLGQSHAAEDLSANIYNIELTSTQINATTDYLPEYGGLNPAFISNNTDPNIHTIAEAEVMVTFIDEGAGYKNTFGYFTYDDNGTVLSQETIFSNASEQGGGGSLLPGDTVSLGTFDAGENIGFWVQANGYNNPDGYTYYTIDSMNPDGLRHVAILADPDTEQLIVGFEDLYNLGDQDYNDVVFTVTASPYSALDTSSIPTGSPEAGPVATTMIGLMMMYFFGRKKGQSDENMMAA